MPTDLFAHPHRRFNPLIQEWILVSPQRTQRPWQGQVERPAPDMRPAYDPTCYLCPGNARAGCARNPSYSGVFVFENDFAALNPNVPVQQTNEQDLLTAQSEPGVCRVVCFTPRHDLTVAHMDTPTLRQVVDVWAEQYLELGARPEINHVQIFENKGAAMGASNPHPHGQIWANASIPQEPTKELRGLQAYADAHPAHCLLCDYAALEERQRQRLVCANDHFLVVVPFWAVWPFETLLISRHHVGSLPELDAAGRTALADIMRRLTVSYDRLFDVSFPYSMGFHQTPTDPDFAPRTLCHLHAHYYPPLLRSATVRKFMVGYEMLGNPQRDITAETAAARLRELADGVA